jgi:hypothetical protein
MPAIPYPDLSPLVGSWRVLSFAMTFTDTTERVEPYGPNPDGRMMLDPGGRIMFLFTKPGRQPAVDEAGRATLFNEMRAKLAEIKEELRPQMHGPLREQAAWLKQVVTGFFQYHAVPTNGAALGAFHHHVIELWWRTLRRRGQKHRMTWRRIGKLADDWLPDRASFTPGRTNASPSNTQGGSRMRESRTYGSVRGARGNPHPYRNLELPLTSRHDTTRPAKLAPTL